MTNARYATAGIRRWVAPAVAAVVLLGLGGCGAEENGLSDAQMVYCLADTRHHALVDAVADLRIAEVTEDGSQVIVGKRFLSPEEWRDVQPVEFVRACRAITPAPPAAASSFLLPGLFGTANVVVGALIAFGVGRWVERSARGRQQARALRTTAAAFVVAAGAYARDLGDRTRAERPTDSDVLERRADLMTELRAVEAEYPRSTANRILATMSTELSADSFREWRVSVPPHITEQLDTLQADVTRLARALEHRARDGRLLRASAPKADGGAS